MEGGGRGRRRRKRHGSTQCGHIHTHTCTYLGHRGEQHFLHLLRIIPQHLHVARNIKHLRVLLWLLLIGTGPLRRCSCRCSLLPLLAGGGRDDGGIGVGGEGARRHGRWRLLVVAAVRGSRRRRRRREGRLLVLALLTTLFGRDGRVGGRRREEDSRHGLPYDVWVAV